MSSDRILGREREVAVLSAVIAAGAERGSVLLVVGEPGIGKSSLLAGARADAGYTGYTVLVAAGVEAEMHLPFGGLQQTLAPLMRHLPALPAHQRDALTTALGLTEGANPDLFLIAEATFGLVSIERAERPVTIVVDDVHWLDPQSHQILTFLAHRSLSGGICVVGAIRPGHPGPFADAGFDRLGLEGVDPQTADQILDRNARGLSTADRKRIHQEAQGNPLALLELPRSWSDGPPSNGQPAPVSARLERAFAGRISELPAGTRDLLLVAAVGSSSDTAETLAALRAMGTIDPSRDLLTPAVVANLITDDGSSIAFRHPLVRSGVLQRETLSRRHAAHAALAKSLTTDTYRSTWHRAWSIVGPDDEVAAALAGTVPDSLRRGAVMSAVSSLERAAQLTSSAKGRGRLLLEAAEAAFGVGRADVVARILRDAAQIDLDELDEIRMIWLAEALNDDARADSARVHQLCDNARRAHGLGDTGLALNILVGAALRCWWADSGGDDQAEVVRVLDRLTDAHDDPRLLAALAIAQPVLRGSDVIQALSSVALQEVHDGDSLRVYGMAAYGAGDLVLATDLLDRAEESFRRDGRLGMLPVVLALQLHIRLDLGDWSGAASASQEVVTISRETGQVVFADNNILVEARGLALRGEWQVALATMATAESEDARLRINDRICLGYQARGTALLSADRPDEAFMCLKRPFDPADRGYHLRESFGGLALMAEAAVACGRTEEARQITNGLEAVSVVTPSPLLEVNLLYARVALAPEGQRETRFREALSRDLTRWPWMRARIQLAYGRWLAGSGRAAEARTQLHAALDVFDRIGAARWSRCAASALEGLDTPGRHGTHTSGDERA